MEFHSSSKAVQQIAIIPSLMSMIFAARTFMRYAYRPAEFHFCELFCHFLSSAIVSDGPHCIPEHNELFHSTFYSVYIYIYIYLSLSLSCSVSHVSLSFFPVFSTGVYVDLYRAARPINISARTFACKSRRRGENDDASRNEHTNAYTYRAFYKRYTQ